MEPRTLRINLVLTQAIVLVLAIVGSLLVHGWPGTLQMFLHLSGKETAVAIVIAAVVLAVTFLIERFLPASWLEDNGINDRIFSGLPVGGILLLCLLVGVSEEWLFRGVLQALLGNVWTSCLFALIHFRYLRKPVLLISVFSISYLLGTIFEMNAHLLGPILAHSLINFVQALFYVDKKRQE